MRVLAGLEVTARLAVRLVTRVVGTVAAASLLLFLMIEVSIPGGYRRVLLPNGDSNAPRALALIEDFHLDSNVFVRWFYWLIDAAQGDFGRSSRNGEEVLDTISHRLPISLQLMLFAVVLTIVIGVPLGVIAAAARKGPLRATLNSFFGLAQSIPIYVTPLFLIWFFALKQRWLPASGWTRISDSFTGNLENLVLPLIALVLAEVGIVARIVQTEVRNVMDSQYIVAAEAKGLSKNYVLFRHALRPASLGLLNVIGLNIGSLLSGALVIELIFGIGGMAQPRSVSAARGHDLRRGHLRRDQHPD